MIIKVMFYRDGQPYGREYSYYSNEAVAVGDIVQINGKATGEVTAIDIPEEEVEAFKGSMKSIMGKVVE